MNLNRCSFVLVNVTSTRPLSTGVARSEQSISFRLAMVSFGIWFSTRLASESLLPIMAVCVKRTQLIREQHGPYRYAES